MQILSVTRVVALAVMAAFASTLLAQDNPAPSNATQTADPQHFETIEVTGSHIPRAQVEGAAPIVVITAEDIKDAGFNSVPDVMKSLTQNLGSVESNQSTNGFTPGASAVDLRGLGPNHTLVLVNGRRIADFPIPYQGLSNFTDISSIPVAMIERIEIVSGSASAIYGSDAVSGVINFILKKKADGTTIDFRVGDTEHGGGGSQRFQISSGWSSGNFDSLFSVQITNQRPLWDFDRPIQDSTADKPTVKTPLAQRNFVRYDPYSGNYIDPGAATCNALSFLNGGTTYYAARPNYGDDGPGYFCGSNEAVAYGTAVNERKAADLYASMTYHFNDHTEAYADIQAGYAKVSLYNDVLHWGYQDVTGSSDETFFNQFTGDLDDWFRAFTPEEAGGLKPGLIRNIDHSYTVNTGLKGSFGDSQWNYDASFNHSQAIVKSKDPEIVASRANAFFLGPQLGVDADSGYPIFNADPSRLYTPLTPAQFAGLYQDLTDKGLSRTENYSLNVNNPSLFTLPAGDVGFAALAEYGNQSYNLRADPLAIDLGYYQIGDTGGAGSRSHYAVGYEFRIPVLSSVNIDTAGRYDNYSYGDSEGGKFTYNLGLEWRPIDSLLVRGSAGTAFRAPDLNFLFAGPSSFHTSPNDYYLCRKNEPGVDIGDCDYGGDTILGLKNGNTQLDNETSKSVTAGFVWSPLQNVDLSVDYYRINLRNQVDDIDIDHLLRDESNCRFGSTESGTPVDINSPTCQAALARVVRLPSNNAVNPDALVSVRGGPINISNQLTSGMDVTIHYRLLTDQIGLFNFSLNFTRVFKHTYQQYPYDPTLNEFDVENDFDVPRSKANATVAWTLGQWTTTLYGSRLGNFTNYNDDGKIGPSFLYNASLTYKYSTRLEFNLAIDNVLDSDPHKDRTYASYPYYDTRWFDPIGRAYYVQATYRFGGSDSK